MLGNKGQASLIDIVLLGLFISILLIVSYYSVNSMEAEVAREELLYSETALLSLLNYAQDEFTVAEKLDLFYCGSENQTELEKEISNFMNITIKPGYNYLLYGSNDNDKSIRVYNHQKSICSRYIPLKSVGLKTSCGQDSIIMLMIWPGWKEIPAECEV